MRKTLFALWLLIAAALLLTSCSPSPTTTAENITLTTVKSVSNN